MAERLGTIFVELDIDTSKYDKGQRRIIDEARGSALGVEQNFRILGDQTNVIYAAMEQRAINAYTAIANSAKASSNEILRAEYAKNQAIQAAQQMQLKPIIESYRTLGLHAKESARLQVNTINDAYDMIVRHKKLTDGELVALEKARVTKIAEINRSAMNAASSEVDSNLAGITRSILRFYAAYYVLRQVVEGLAVPFIKGFEAVENYNKSIASMSAMVVTFSDAQDNLKPEERWKNALLYSRQMIPVLETIAAKTLLSGNETVALANAFAHAGVFLDANNKKQLEAFQTISNALPLMTEGQQIMVQINSEIRSLMTGTQLNTSMLLQTLKAIDPEIEDHLKIWRAEGTVLEHIGELLIGFGNATELLSNTWRVIKSTLGTTVNQILRGAMAPVYQDIIESVKALNEYLLKHKEFANGLLLSWKMTQGVFESIGNIIKPISPEFKMMAGYAKEFASWMAFTAYAVLPPLTEKLSYLLKATHDLVTNRPLKEVWNDLKTGYQMDLNDAIEKRTDKLAAMLNGTQEQLSGAQAPRPSQLSALLNDINELEKKRKQLEEKTKEGALKALEEEYKLKREVYLNESTLRRNTVQQDTDYAINLMKWYIEKKQLILSEHAKDGEKAIRKEQSVVNDILAKRLQDNKASYELTLKQIDGETKARQIKGNYEIDTINQRYESQVNAANKLYELNNAIIDKEIKDDRLKAEQKKINHTNLLKEIQIAENLREDAIDKANQKSAEVNETLYKTLDKYSAEATEAEINRLTLLYLEYQRYANKTIDIEKARRMAINAINDKKAMDQLQNDIMFLEETQAKEEEWFNKKIKLIELERKMRIELATTEAQRIAINAAADRKLYDAKLTAIDKEQAKYKDLFSTVRTMYQNSQGLFEEGSRAQRAMSDLNKAALIGEQVMILEKNAMILATYLAQKDMATDLAITNAAASVAAQGTVPITGFGAAAAMLTFMSGVLSIAGIAFGGKSGGSVASTAETTHTGWGYTSVSMTGGNSMEDSMSKILDILNKSYSMQNYQLSTLNASMNHLKRLSEAVTRTSIEAGAIDLSKYDIGSVVSESSASTAQKLLAGGILGGGTTLLIQGMAALLGKTGGTVGSIAEKIAGYIDKAESLVAGFFSGTKSTTTYVQGQGLYLSGNTAGTYADMVENEVKKRLGRVTRTQTFWTDYDANQSLTDLFYGENGVYESLKHTVSQLVSGLGGDVSAALNYKFADIKIDLTGLDAAGIQKKIQEYITSIGSTMTQDVIGSILKPYQKVNESLLETATRILTNKEIIEATLRQLGEDYKDLPIAINESLVTAADGIDKFQSVASRFYDRFFTETEKHKYLQTELTAALAQYNLALPATREGYKQLVRSLNLADASTHNAYIALLNFADAADQFYGSASDAITSFADLAKTISQWLHDITLDSRLAPAVSQTDYQSEYVRLRTDAFAEGATDDTIRQYMDYAKTYLGFMRQYGGDYQNTFDQVTSDMAVLGEAMKESKSVAELQLEQAKLQTVYLYNIAEGLNINVPATPAFASGGLAIGKSIMGEAGPEWAVPTYEPQRSGFLKNAPPSFWNNLFNSSGISVDGEKDIHVHVHVDGSEIGNAVAKQIPRNSNLYQAIQRVQ